MPIIILGIESSCDDTSASVLKEGKILSNHIANQEIHKLYGGIVPEVASRAHQENILPVVDQAIKNAKIEKKDISAIAFTRGPGLMGSLIVGVSFAKSLAQSLGIPIIEVHHMRAHVLAHFIDDPKPTFPFLCLTVSGGHTQIVKVLSHSNMEIIGQTRDDAAGEAFDKSGKLLGLDYPAGPLIDKYAQLGSPIYPFTEPKIDGLDFSFSGLKTGILYFLQREMKNDPTFIQNNLNDICASIQHRIVSILINKLKKAHEQTGISQLAIAGGVSANSGLRKAVQDLGSEIGGEVFIPKFEYCTDNAAMIAISGYYKYLNEDFAAWDISANPRIAM